MFVILCFFTSNWVSRLVNYYFQYGRIWVDDDGQWQCIHHGHSKEYVQQFMCIRWEYVVGDTLFVRCHIWMRFYVKNNHLQIIRLYFLYANFGKGCRKPVENCTQLHQSMPLPTWFFHVFEPIQLVVVL